MESTHSSIDISGPVFCVITGASQGIGRALAIEFAKNFGPYSIILLLARNKNGLAETASLCESNNVKVVFESLDLSCAGPEEMFSIIEDSLSGRSIQEFSKSIIVHNVGSLGNLKVHCKDMENNKEMSNYYNLNVFNVITLNTQFLKLVQGHEDDVIIVNITSLCAIKPMSGMTYYCSGKAAREMYFRVLAEELPNIKILNYAPGPIETAMIDEIIESAINEKLQCLFKSFKDQGNLIKAETTAAKCISILKEGKFTPAQHVDFFD